MTLVEGKVELSTDPLTSLMDDLKIATDVLTSFGGMATAKELLHSRLPGVGNYKVAGRTWKMNGIIRITQNLSGGGHDDWECRVFSPGTILDPELPHRDIRSLVYLLREEEVAGKSVTQQSITLSHERIPRTLSPQMKFYDRQILNGRVQTLDPELVEGSYPFKVVTQVADKLRREASGLLALLS